jgi:PST family polysaccharide transporter
MYLGTLGVGLMGTYSSITGMVGSLCGLGIGSSGVRQIAEAAGTGDQILVARTVRTIRRTAAVLGLAGTLLMMLVAGPICRLTFGNNNQTRALELLSVTILFGALSSGQTALVQGARRIGDLARLNVLGACLGTAVAVPLMILWGRDSIVAILLASSSMTILASWHYARRISVPDIVMTWRETCREAAPLLRLGLVFAASGLMASGVAYSSRLVIIRRLGVDAAGLYGAAWSLSSFYVGFILGAMGADFYPRLTGASHDHAQMNRLVNEQTEVSLLLTLPGVVATLTFAPFVIHLLYSPAFLPAGELLRWQVLGLLLRVVSWSMSFILLAKGNARLYFGTELAANLVHVALIWLGVAYWGLPGAGIAFLAVYVFHTILMAVVTWRLTAFSWTSANVRLFALTACVSVSVFLGVRLFPAAWSTWAGAALAAATGVYSLRMLTRLAGSNPALLALRRMKAILPWHASA